MKGTKHFVYGYRGGEVVLSNKADGCTRFKTPMELASFIEELRAIGRWAFDAEAPEDAEEEG